MSTEKPHQMPQDDAEPEPSSQPTVLVGPPQRASCASVDADRRTCAGDGVDEMQPRAGEDAMTPGERMVWAAEFVRALADHPQRDADQAAFSAGLAVEALRRVARHNHRQSPEIVAELDEMVGKGKQ